MNSGQRVMWRWISAAGTRLSVSTASSRRSSTALAVHLAGASAGARSTWRLPGGRHASPIRAAAVSSVTTPPRASRGALTRSRW